MAKSNENILSFDYDHQGRRISKSPGLGLPVRNYLYDGDNIYGDYGSWANPPGSLYVHGPNTDEPLISLQGGTTPYFYHQDGLGSVVALTVPTGVFQIQLFDAWGSRLTPGSAIPQYGYTGREPDENGLLYYRARHYDPTIGRFLQRDPIGFEGGLNMYAYVSNNPTNKTDPTGLWTPDWDYWTSVGTSTFGLANNVAGAFVGGIGMMASSALMAAPEPLITKGAAVFTGSISFATFSNSVAGIPNDTRNVWNALSGSPTNYSNSGTKLIADSFFPGNQNAKAIADGVDLGLAFGSGRMTVGSRLLPGTQGSALSTWGPANINQLLDANASRLPSNVSSYVTKWSDTRSSPASMALNTLGFTQASTALAQYGYQPFGGNNSGSGFSGIGPLTGFGGAGNGGFSNSFSSGSWDPWKP